MTLGKGLPSVDDEAECAIIVRSKDGIVVQVEEEFGCVGVCVWEGGVQPFCLLRVGDWLGGSAHRGMLVGVNHDPGPVWVRRRGQDHPCDP